MQEHEFSSSKHCCPNSNNTSGGDIQNTATDSALTGTTQTTSPNLDTTAQNAAITTNQTDGGQEVNVSNTANATSNAVDTTNQNGVNTSVNATQNTEANIQKTDQNSNQTQNTNDVNTARNDVKNDEVAAAVVASKTTEKPVNTVPSAEKGITYKVQILAAHRVVDKSYLKRKFSFEEDYNIENHNGWIKYTTGMYTQYKDARDARVKITSASSKLPGPFVTAYNDGERITVQEALLVSKQLWYK
jgi:hypothetical protein